MTLSTKWKRTFSLITLFVAPSPLVAQDVRIGVLGLFHPREFVVSAVPGSGCVVRTGEKELVLEGSSGVSEVRLRFMGGAIAVETPDGATRSGAVTVASRDNGSADFMLAIPGKIARRYHGTLRVIPSSASLLAVVSMDLETAVASVVAAESGPDAPVEALKAQAVVARSYLLAAKGRHHGFDFCDTTHCQFLREPPASDTIVGRAVAETSGFVLTYDAEPLAAMYMRSCAGSTRTLTDVGLRTQGYPYYRVSCKYCREHPSTWQSKISSEGATDLRPSNESARLDIDRLLGWSTVPSNTFTMRSSGDNVLLQGVGQGHGVGMCQAGAAAMAREGASFLEILAHYYPNTAVTNFKIANNH